MSLSEGILADAEELREGILVVGGYIRESQSTAVFFSLKNEALQEDSPGNNVWDLA